MKKILSFLLAVTMFMSVASLASAEKIKFKDKNGFDFSKYRTVQITSLTPINIDTTGFVTDNAAASKITTLLRSGFNSKNIELKTLDEINTEEQSVNVPSLEIKIYQFGYDKNYRAAWDETYFVNRSIDKKDKHGRHSSISIPIPQTVHHPARYFYTAQVDLEFNLKNSNNKVVYSIRDTRSRADEQDTSGMLKRVISDFVDDVTKN